MASAARLVLCYWFVKRSNECIAHGPARRAAVYLRSAPTQLNSQFGSTRLGRVKQFQGIPRLFVCYLSRVGRPCPPGCLGTTERRIREFAWIILSFSPSPPLPSSAYPSREISCLRGNGQVMRYKHAYAYACMHTYAHARATTGENTVSARH